MSATTEETVGGSGLQGAPARAVPLPRVAAVATPVVHQTEAFARDWVWFELTARTQLSLRGRDRQKFLHNFCTNDIKNLGENRGCEAFVTSVQGKLLGQVTVWNGPGELLLSGPAGQGPRLLRHLMKYHINEEVEFLDVTDRRVSLLIAGREADRGCRTLGLDAVPSDNLSQRETTFREHPVTIRREEWLGSPAYELTMAADFLAELRAETARHGVAAGPELFDWLRIGAGFPWYGLDLDEGNLAQEASRTAESIHFRKGCYLGQEPIARIDALGHVNQQIRRVVLAGEHVPSPGAELRTGDESPRPAGRITSAARNPAGDGVRALALVRRGWETPGMPLQVDCGGAWRDARVDWGNASK